MDLMQVRRRRAGIVDWLRANGQLNRTPLVVYTSADIDPAELPRLASGETVLFLAERSTSAEVQARIVDLLAKIGTQLTGPTDAAPVGRTAWPQPLGAPAAARGGGARRGRPGPPPVTRRPRRRAGGQSLVTSSSPSAYCLRITFLSNLPTLVFGTAGMTAQRSGTCHWATRLRRGRRAAPRSRRWRPP